MPAAMAVNAPAGGSLWLAVLLPQQRTRPWASSMQLCSEPAAIQPAPAQRSQLYPPLLSAQVSQVVPAQPVAQTSQAAPAQLSGQASALTPVSQALMVNREMATQNTSSRNALMSSGSYQTLTSKPRGHHAEFTPTAQFARPREV